MNSTARRDVPDAADPGANHSHKPSRVSAGVTGQCLDGRRLTYCVETCACGARRGRLDVEGNQAQLGTWWEVDEQADAEPGVGRSC